MKDQTRAQSRDDIGVTHEFEADGFSVRCTYEASLSDQLDPILYLPGAFQNSRGMRPLRDRLRSKGASITIATPGAVGDEVLPRTYDFRWLAEVVATALDLMGQSRVNIVAASYGVGVGVCFASQYPTRVNRLVLAGAIEYFDAAVASDVEHGIALLTAGRNVDFARFALGSRLMNMDPGVEIKRRQQVFRVMFRQLSRLHGTDAARYIENSYRVLGAEYYIERVQRPSLPVLGFTGEHDILTTPERCRDFVRTFPHGTFATIAATDHLFALEDFERTFELVEGFFCDDDLDALAGLSSIERPALVG